MVLLNFVRVLSVVSLAVIHASFDALPVNALAVERAHVGRSLGHPHAEIARKRDSSKKCRPRPSSSSASHSVAAAATHSVATTTSPPAVPSSHPSQSAQSITSSQPPSTPTPSSSGGSKILLGWSNNQQDSLKNFVTSQTHDIYNWKEQPYPLSNLGPSANIFKDSLRFIPTLARLENVLNAASIPKNVPKRGPIKTYNEPELSGQANINPDYGYQLWMEHILPLANQGYELIAPSITTSDLGHTWISEFFKRCNNQCRVSAMDLHHYSTSVTEFQNATERFHGDFKYQLWISEIACHDYSGKNQQVGQAGVDAFYHGVMAYALKTDFIVKISYYGLFTPEEEQQTNVNPLNSMITCTGSISTCMPNSLGHRFINAQS